MPLKISLDTPTVATFSMNTLKLLSISNCIITRDLIKYINPFNNL